MSFASIAPAFERSMGGDGIYSTPARDIRGIQLVDIDHNSEHAINYDSDDAFTPHNKDIYLVKEHDSVLIGRAPQSSRSTRFGRSSEHSGRPVPPNSWVHTSPVLSRSHAIVTISKDKVFISDAGSHHGVWRSWCGTVKRVQQDSPVRDGDVFTLGKQVEKHGKVHYPAHVKIKFVYADGDEPEPLSAGNDAFTTATGSKTNHFSTRSNRYGLDSTDSDDMDSSMDMDRYADYSDEFSADEHDQDDPFKYAGGYDAPLYRLSRSSPGSSNKLNDLEEVPSIARDYRSDLPPWRRHGDLDLGLGLHSYDSTSLASFSGTQINEIDPYYAPGAPARTRFREYPYPGSDNASSQSHSEATSYIPWNPDRTNTSVQLPGPTPTNLTSINTLLHFDISNDSGIFRSEDKLSMHRPRPSYIVPPLDPDRRTRVLKWDDDEDESSDMDASASEDDDIDGSADKVAHVSGNSEKEDDSSASVSDSESEPESESEAEDAEQDEITSQAAPELPYSTPPPEASMFPSYSAPLGADPSGMNEPMGLAATDEALVSETTPASLPVTPDLNDAVIIATPPPSNSNSDNAQESDWDFTPPPQTVPAAPVPVDVSSTHASYAPSEAASAYFTPPPEGSVDSESSNNTSAAEDHSDAIREETPVPAPVPLPVEAAAQIPNPRKRVWEDSDNEDEDSQDESDAPLTPQKPTSALTAFVEPMMLMDVDVPNAESVVPQEAAEQQAPLTRPRKRARVSSSTKGFIAGAVAGSALTWAGLAFL